MEENLVHPVLFGAARVASFPLNRHSHAGKPIRQGCGTLEVVAKFTTSMSRSCAALRARSEVTQRSRVRQAQPPGLTGG